MQSDPSDYIKLIKDLHILGEQNNVSINLTDLHYINAKGLNIMLYSKHKGNILNKIKKSEIIISLEPSLWREVLEYFLSISFFPSYNYIDFDGKNLFEDANFIISSEKTNK